MAELDVFVVGGVGVDIIVRVPELPLPISDFKVPPIRQYVAHTGNGVALGCHALGLRTHFAAVLGPDPEGEFVLAHYVKQGLSFEHVTDPSGTPRSVNLVGPDGERLSLHDGRLPRDLVVDPELYRPALARARHAHVSIGGWTRPALAAAVEAGVSTSTDLHGWDGIDPSRQDFAYGADLVFTSTHRLGDRVETVAEDVLARGRARIVVAMAGGGGCYVKLPDAPLRHVPALPLRADEVVDTNGAGDSFVSGFLYAYLAGRDWATCVRAGTHAGAHAVRTAGTHTSFVTAEELDRALD
ncbi:carbohydrate kinase family protein [Embleya sp. NBC_00896]|uniref:carbohydrate kinase family protein n=1 Tax=Embleya sp. NBC_00896 TaxID=2975961 RepID=UPI003867E95A|nr:carbohydrate kinase family protein [Embleya sp. NBC_00896]